MIVLTSTYKLQLVLSAGTADVDVDYNDRTTTAYGPSDSQQTAATAATNDICTAPAASTSREINGLTVTYKTTGGTATLQKLNSSGAVTTKLWVGVLLVGENIIYTHGGGLVVLDANGNRKEVTSSIFSSITSTGLLDISASGAGQVKFPATQNASSDANTLDDYEEGTWTPVDASAGALTFTNNAGTYEKIGRQFRASCFLTYPANADGSNALVGGLPFTVANANEARQGYISLCGEVTAFQLTPPGGTTTFNIRGAANANITNLTMSTDSFAGTVLTHV